jgi:hypothetical protein
VSSTKIRGGWSGEVSKYNFWQGLKIIAPRHGPCFSADLSTVEICAAT